MGSEAKKCMPPYISLIFFARYDAGDHIKFSFPMAWSTTTLAWGIHEYEDAYRQAGELDHALEGIKWPLDFLMKAHPDENTFYVQVGDGNADHEFW